MNIGAGGKCWGLHALGQSPQPMTDGSRCINILFTCLQVAQLCGVACSILSTSLTELDRSGRLTDDSPLLPSFFFMSHIPTSLLGFSGVITPKKCLHSNPCLRVYIRGNPSKTREIFLLTEKSLWHLILGPIGLAIDSKHVKAEIPALVIYFMEEKTQAQVIQPNGYKDKTRSQWS